MSQSCSHFNEEWDTNWHLNRPKTMFTGRGIELVSEQVNKKSTGSHQINPIIHLLCSRNLNDDSGICMFEIYHPSASSNKILYPPLTLHQQMVSPKKEKHMFVVPTSETMRGFEGVMRTPAINNALAAAAAWPGCWSLWDILYM